MTNGPDLTQWRTPSGALTQYEQYWTPATDAPREYILACGLSVIATAIGNRVYVQFGGDRLFPNDWKVLLGPSSTFRKSTTVKQARRTLARLSDTDPGHGLLFPDEFSKEALVTRLSECAQGLLTYSEFSGALAAFGRDYMSGTKELLADLYDSPSKYQRLVGKQTITATNVCIGILAASQTDWLLEKLRDTDIRGGFLARFTFWPAFTKRRFLAIPPEPDGALGNQLIRSLQKLRRLEGAISLPSTVRDRYTAWLDRHERSLDALPRAGQIGPFWSRMAVTTLKMALAINVSADDVDNPLLMSEAAIEAAIGLTEFLKLSLAQLFDEEIAFTPDMRNRQKVLQMIRRKPGIAFRDISRNANLLKRPLEAVLETLKAEGLIDCKEGRFFPVSESVAVGETLTDKQKPMIARVK